MEHAEHITVTTATYADILLMRDMRRQEMNCQIRNDSYHERGFTAIYQIHWDGKVAGYGCVGEYDVRGKEVVTEFYLAPPHRREAQPCFQALIQASEATRIEVQTNDRLLTLMLFDFCAMETITSPVILFEDVVVTDLQTPEGVIFKRVPVVEPPGGRQVSRDDIVAEVDGKIAGKAGFLCHYNPPYGDVWMEVEEPFRGKGIGSYLVQEAKRACYETGRRPSARCNVTNVISRRTLQRAGFLPCARILHGHIVR